MRPEILYPLFASVSTLPGIGPRLEKLVSRAAGPKIIDLLGHLPVGLVDRRRRPTIAAAVAGETVTMEIVVGAHIPSKRRGLPYLVHVRDATGEMQLIFFNGREDYLNKTLPEGSTRVISGRFELYQGQAQMTHPDHIVAPEELASLPLIEPVYGLTAGLTLKVIQKGIRAALKKLPELPEWQDPAWRRKQVWPDWHDALIAVHNPQGEDDLAPMASARARLAFDELLANQLALSIVRARMRRLPGRAVKGDGQLRAQAIAGLPYTLTGAQRMALGEIEADMNSDRRMLRLLQGDVGSGKTIVALLAMLNAVEANAQAALMVPTEILARQHYASLKPLCDAIGVRVEVLTGRDKGKRRTELLAALAAGEIHILIGTHALFQDEVVFRALALVVVDEQHRFGVHQRLQLQAKGGVGTDILVMTATPIPRTLTLTAYGDMDVSKLDEKPAGRKPVETRALPIERLEDVVSAIDRAVQAGAQVYWVCPLVEESDEVDAAAAEERYKHLSGLFGAKVGLVHGRMKEAAKDTAMADFEQGATRILVATTVIEVGVNVPAATVMVIEHAERFGLAQLHQLRGRVGRGGDKSSCLLLYQLPLSETATRRIRILRETEDGFRIAEEDLRLRGAGELLGTRQSGLPAFRYADLNIHAELMQAAWDDARLVLGRDPELKSARGEALRTLLYLFERDDAIRYWRSG